MAGPDSSDLFAVARLLLSAGPANPPSEAQLRRAVSTAYYAVFHMIVRAGADRFMGTGKDRNPGYGLFYRGFGHRRMKTVFESLSGTKWSRTLQQQLCRTAVTQEMQQVAGAFATLQEARHLADYDPFASFALSDCADLVDVAETAMSAFDQVTPDEKADVLALMLVGGRA